MATKQNNMLVPASQCAAMNVIHHAVLKRPATAAPLIVDDLAIRGFAICSSGLAVEDILKVWSSADIVRLFAITRSRLLKAPHRHETRLSRCMRAA